jgi:dihydroxyacetone kinase-like protein
MRSADEIVNDLVNAILEDLKPEPGSEALLMVNGFTGTPLMELYLIYNAAEKLLKERGINVTRSLVGDYTTSLEMAGASITVCLLDDEIRRHWDAPVHTAALRWGR